MKKIAIKFLMIYLTVSFFSPIFSISAQKTNAQAVTTPTPTNGCEQTIESGLPVIKCSFNAGEEAVFRFHDFYKTDEILIDDLYQVWSLGNAVGTQLSGLSLLTKGYPNPEVRGDVKIFYIGIAATENEFKLAQQGTPLPDYPERIARDVETANMDAGYIQYKRFNTSNNKMEGSKSYLYVTRKGWHGLDTGFDSNTKNNPTYKALNSLLPKMPNLIVPKPEFKNVDTADDKFKQCSIGADGKSLLTRPISSLKDSTGGTTDGLAQYYDDMKKRWLTDLEEAIASASNEDEKKQLEDTIEQVNKYFNSGGSNYKKVDDLKIYKKFYDGDFEEAFDYPNHYPTVIIDKNLITQYEDLATDMNNASVSTYFDGLPYWGIAGTWLRAGGISMTDISDFSPPWTDTALNAATAFNPALAGLNLANGVADYLTAARTSGKAAILKDMEKYYFANIYIKNNLRFYKCMGQEYSGLTDAEIDQMIANIDSNLKGYFSLLEGTDSSGEGETVCDNVNSKSAILNMIAKAFCGFAILTNKWAGEFFLYALKLMQSSIGVD